MQPADSNYYLLKLHSRLPRDIKGHSARVSVLMSIITNGYIDLKYSFDGKFAGASRQSLVLFAREAGSYHDIGKIMVPYQLLEARRKLTYDEAEEVKKHPLYAAKLLDDCMKNLSTGVQHYFREVKKVCVTHHERWDGTGYPYGQRDEEIPVFSRICAIADVYDNWTSGKYGTEKKDHGKAVKEINRLSGSQFDPKAVAAFINKSDEIHELLSNKSYR